MLADEDVRLMLAFKEGDEESFRELVRKYERPLLNFIYRFTQDRDEAEDLAQETFVRVYRSKESYEPRAKFSTWIYRIAANASLDHRARKKRDAVSRARPLEPFPGPGGEEELAPQIPDTAQGTPEQAAERRHTEERVRACLLALPENQRLALVLKVYEDRSYLEIAEILGTSIPAVESLIFRARQSLKDRLCDELQG